MLGSFKLCVCLFVYNQGYICTCYSGYMGINCEIDADECLSVPCLNNGTCLENSDPSRPGFDLETAEGYMCECLKGFTGMSKRLLILLSFKDVFDNCPILILLYLGTVSLMDLSADIVE